ncbi:MAG TPA: SCP2 domain-containing protein, partial [Lysobacter sp.]
DYVQHESQDVVGRAELAAFFDDIDTVRDDVDRLAARVARLSGRGA